MKLKSGVQSCLGAWLAKMNLPAVEPCCLGLRVDEFLTAGVGTRIDGNFLAKELLSDNAGIMEISLQKDCYQVGNKWAH